MKLFKILWDYFSETSVYDIITDKWFASGVSGSLITLIVPTMENITHIVQFFAALGGLLLVCLSVTQKILEIKKLKKDGHSNKRDRKP